MSQKNTFTRADLIQLFQLMIERNSPLLQKQEFRKYLDRDQNLFANQVLRESTGNIAYKTVDFKVDENLSDNEFWNRIDETPYNDLIEDNAAVAIMKMAEKLRLLN